MLCGDPRSYTRNILTEKYEQGVEGEHTMQPKAKGAGGAKEESKQGVQGEQAVQLGIEGPKEEYEQQAKENQQYNK